MHDAVIIGGGPAGSTAAALLAREGKSVLVIEKERFPRFHVGESLLPYNREIFEEIGVWEKVKASGFVVKRGAQFSTGSGEPRARLVFASGLFTEHPDAFQVERAKFDELLLRHARESGAVVCEGALVLGHRIETGKAVVRFRDESGDREAEGRFLLDASGMASFTGVQEGIRQVYPHHRKVAVFGHFSKVDMPSCEEAGDIVLIVRERSWCWLIPLDCEKTSVGIVFDRDEFSAAGEKPEVQFENAIRGTPELARRMAGAERLSPLHVISDYSYRIGRIVSPRLIRIGDAAGFLDPIFSSGVMLAMQSGRDGARCVLGALASGQTLTAEMRRYEKNHRSAMSRFWSFIERFYIRHFLDFFLQPSGEFQMNSAINAVLAGRPDMPWKVRWRLRLFFTLVAAQKRFPIVKRIPWAGR